MKNEIFYGDVLDFYDEWEKPKIIISDGPYGVNGYEGDAKNHRELLEMYRPHIQKWTERAEMGCTLWFWNTEIGWATVHPLFEEYGWEYRGINVWNKGIGFIAGNVNTKTMSRFPAVSEVCVQYVYPPKFKFEDKYVAEKEWLRLEWQRTGLPFSKTNEACGVKAAATRKYFTKDNLWYSPPASTMEKLVEYANKYGKKETSPYFTTENGEVITEKIWEEIHPRFQLPIGWTNVWNVSQLSGKERIKVSGKNKSLHYNQKPLELMDLIIKSSSKSGEILWEPFGGLVSASISAKRNNIESYAAEINKDIYLAAKNRLESYAIQESLLPQ